jgi:phosphoserine aminotransferase
MANLTPLVLLLLSTQLLASNVIDISGPLTVSAFTCLASAGYTCVIVRGNTLQNSNSIMHPYVIQTLLNVRSAGLPADIYMNVCRGVGALTQVTNLISSITATNYKTIWVKI